MNKFGMTLPNFSVCIIFHLTKHELIFSYCELVEHCIASAEVQVSNPVQAWFNQDLISQLLKLCRCITAMINHVFIKNTYFIYLFCFNFFKNKFYLQSRILRIQTVLTMQVSLRYLTYITFLPLLSMRVTYTENTVTQLVIIRAAYTCSTNTPILYLRYMPNKQ